MEDVRHHSSRNILKFFNFNTLSLQERRTGFAAALVVLITGASQSRQHGVRYPKDHLTSSRPSIPSVSLAHPSSISAQGPHYTKDCPLKEEVKAFEEAFYMQYGVPFPLGGRFRAAAPGFYQRDNRNPSYQEQRQTMEESTNKFMAESAKRHDENLILIKEIRSSTDAAIRNKGASIKALEIQIGQMSKVLQEKGPGSLHGSTKTNPIDHVKSISMTIETDTTSISHIGGARYAVLDNQNRMQTFKPNQSTIPFPSRLTDDCYDEMNVLDSATYGIFKEE
ncbi:hypothetical protein Tco_0805308 [Tanacetum coccineum]